MPIYTTTNNPDQNLTILAGNPYPGRLLVMGYVDETAVQAYGICGRSEDSRNRLLVLEDNIISTRSHDISLPVSNPELTIYDALRRTGSVHIVSNGDQTATAIQYLRCGRSFEDAMNSRRYEPDAPNFTSRISGFIDIEAGVNHPKFGLSLIRKDAGSEQTVRTLFTDSSPEIRLESGIGYALHTYQGNDNPLPPFDEAPFKLPILKDAKSMADLLWNNMDIGTRVSVAVKTIAPDNNVNFHIINLHEL